MAFQVRPWLDFGAREFHAGRFPLWDPYLYAGQSLIGQVQTGAANPLNWILFALPLRDGHIPLATLHWYWLLIHWLGAVFCYALCRELGSGRPASVLGGSVFAFTGYLGHTDWPQMLMSATWTPLVLLFLTRVFRGKRPLGSAAAGGALLGLAFLGTHHNILIYTALLTGMLWVWFLITNRRSPGSWVLAPLFWTMALAVSAFQVLPAIEYGRQAVRWVGAAEPLRWHDKVPFAIHAQYSLPVRGIAAMVIPHMWDGLPVNPYVGFTALGLAVLAIIQCHRKREIRWMAAVAAAGLILALGSHTPVYRLLYAAVPLVEKARSPAMAIVLAQLGIAALTALGLESVARKRVWIFSAVFMLFAVEAVLAAPRFARLDRHGGYLHTIHDHEDIAKFLKAQPGWFRIEVDDAAVPYNFGDWFGVEEFGGYTASLPEKVFRFVGQDETRRLFGIRYRVGRQARNPDESVVFESRSGLKVYRHDGVEQPVWSTCSGMDPFRIVLRQPDRFIVDADMSCAGLMITGDPRLSGWQAWRDGRRTAVQEYRGVLRAVSVPAGHHRIEFYYRPASVYWGAAISIIGILMAAFLYSREGQKVSTPPAGFAEAGA
jgi:hypothetical protein